MVTNAATREKDIAWLRRESKPFSVELTERPDLAILAVQGPDARDATLALLPPFMAKPASNLKRFRACHVGEWFIGRTGYTGEDGFEIILPGEDAPGLWNKLLESGVWPCGLGARDTLRLEAGMALYGADLSEEYTPLESGLAWTVDLGDEAREFNGHEAVLRQKTEGSALQMTGLVLEGRGVLRAHQAVFDRDRKLGEITSGTFSPTLEKSVALARLSLVPDAELEVEIRGRRVKTRAVKYPFVRNGRACI
jgi:aminomethyltransferase